MNWSFRALDRRIIYAIVLIAVSWPLITGYVLKPVRMHHADQVFEIVNGLKEKPGGVALVAMDYGPSTIAENGVQSELTIEHLMRKRIPIALFSQYQFATPFLESIPRKVAQKLESEIPLEKWEYGKDWINLGYRPGGAVFIQAIPKAESIADYFKTDVNGTEIRSLPKFAKLKTLQDIIVLAQFTGLTGVFNDYVRYFQRNGYRPIFVHGCTSITIPDAYTYLDAKQLDGLLEGNAGASWYSVRMSEAFENRAIDQFLVSNTALGIAHLSLLGLIIIGNIGSLLDRRRKLK